MRSSPTLSLFNQAPPTNQRSSAFLVSIFVHGAVVGLVIYGFIYGPRIRMRDPAELYRLRRVDLNSPDPEIRRESGDSSMYPGANIAAKIPSPTGRIAAPSSALRQLEKKMLADKTLVQPDTEIKMALKTNQLPSLLLWSAPKPDVHTITPPPIQKPATASVIPSFERPNKEPVPSELKISSTDFTSTKPMPVPGSSSPIVVKGPEPVQHVIETSSLSSTMPSSIAVMSVSELHMAQGTMMVPPADTTAHGSPNGALRPGTSGNSPLAGNGDPSSKGSDAGVKANQGAPGNSGGALASNSGPGSGSGNHNPGPGAGQGNGHGTDPLFTRVPAPPPGQFGVVVVGHGMVEEFPETAEVWSDRLVYSVYLHVGLSRSWILQYSIPSSAEAASAGNIKHVEAPWPYSIVRPNINPDDINADALMVHGFINESGHFETLSLAFPPKFAQTQYVLQALQQWRFRPAKQNGQVARVEILLIIPEDAR